MPFGLCNAPATFHLLMQALLRGLERFCLAYIDDVVIFSTDFDDHLAYITIVHRLATEGLSKKCNCCWVFESFEAQVQYIKDYLLPTTKPDLRAFWDLQLLFEIHSSVF